MMVTNAAQITDDDDQVFAALADSHRRRILTLLSRQPAAVHDLSGMFRISRPAVSRHLKVLRDAGLVHVDRRGTENIYVLETERLRLVEAWLGEFWRARVFTLKSLAEDTYGAPE